MILELSSMSIDGSRKFDSPGRGGEGGSRPDLTGCDEHCDRVGKTAVSDRTVTSEEELGRDILMPLAAATASK
jgi:hypothetical protein